MASSAAKLTDRATRVWRTTIRSSARWRKSGSKVANAATLHEPGWGETRSNPDFPDRSDSRARRSLAPPLDGFMARIRAINLWRLSLPEPSRWFGERDRPGCSVRRPAEHSCPKRHGGLGRGHPTRQARRPRSPILKRGLRLGKSSGFMTFPIPSSPRHRGRLALD